MCCNEITKAAGILHSDRLVFATLYRIAPRIVNALAIVEPDTVIRWIVPVFDCSGDGSRGVAAAGQEFPAKFAN
jgi:hypothetical protein